MGDEHKRYIGDTRTWEFHEKDCEYTNLIPAKNKKIFSSIQNVLEQGFKGCDFCTKQQYDIGYLYDKRKLLNSWHLYEKYWYHGASRTSILYFIRLYY